MFFAPPALAQILRGTVLDSASGRPVAGVHVIVFPAAGSAVGDAVTATDGEFKLRVPASGAYRVRASRMGYSTTMTESIAVSFGLDSYVQLRLAPSPVSLDTLSVVAESVTVEKQIPYLADAGFYRRRRIGFGYFLTRTDLEKHSSDRMTDAFSGFPAVHVVCTGKRMPVICDVEMPGAETMFVRGICRPSVVVDGVVVRTGGVGNTGDLGIDELLNPFNIEAVEVYLSPAGIPPQWGGYVSPCGAIVAWSRR